MGTHYPFAHLAGLVPTRMVSGVGMVPYFDCANGTVAGKHNATIERSNLASSHDGEAAPCVAAISSRAIATGEYVTVRESNATLISIRTPRAHSYPCSRCAHAAVRWHCVASS